MLKITAKRPIYLGISIILMIASAVSLLVQGFNLDTDFAGGMAVTYSVNSEFEVKDIEKLVSEALGANRQASSVQRSGNEVVIKFGHNNKLETEAERNADSEALINAITTKLSEKYTISPDFTKDIVSPSTGKELARSAVWMSVLAALAILIYITFRFEFLSGVCAVFALFHDILILCGVYSILRIAIDTNFIAAILTVLGYSINATIVIFDRIRENTRHAKKQTYSEIANTSINQTLTRSIYTTLTTLFTIGMVYILGVQSIKVFALPIIIGMFVGTYSSIFVSGSLWSLWKDSAVKSKAVKKK